MFKIMMDAFMQNSPDGEQEEYKAVLSLSKTPLSKSIVLVEPHKSLKKEDIVRMYASIGETGVKAVYPIKCSCGVFWYAMDAQNASLHGDNAETVTLNTKSVFLTKGLSECEEPILFDLEEVNSRKKIEDIFLEFTDLAKEVRRIMGRVAEDADAREIDTSHETV